MTDGRGVDCLLVGARGPGLRLLRDALRGHPRLTLDRLGDSDVLVTPPATWSRPARARSDDRLRIETVPDGLLLPGLAVRARAWLGEHLRLVAVLDDPLVRAADHHRTSTNLGLEDLPLERALGAEQERIGSALADPTLTWASPADPVRWASYATGGRYADGLRRWEATFGSSALLALPATDLYADPDAALSRVLAHLGAEPHPVPSWLRLLPAPEPPRPRPSARALLSLA